jgi:proteic killer suppression protein/toxin YoeB
LTLAYNDDVKKYFDDLNAMSKKIGHEMTRSVKKRLDALKASKNFWVYLTTGLGHPHALEGILSGHYAIRVTANVRLVVQPCSEDLSPAALQVCEELTIKGVADYHGSKHDWLIP